MLCAKLHISSADTANCMCMDMKHLAGLDVISVGPSKHVKTLADSAFSGCLMLSCKLICLLYDIYVLTYAWGQYSNAPHTHCEAQQVVHTKIKRIVGCRITGDFVA